MVVAVDTGVYVGEMAVGGRQGEVVCAEKRCDPSSTRLLTETGRKRGLRAERNEAPFRRYILLDTSCARVDFLLSELA